MTTAKYLFIPILATSLLVLAGCTTQTATNTNTVNDNALPTQTGNVEVVTNTNETVSNENTNTTNESGEVDTSDWLTYENTEIGMKFLYPKDWTVSESLYSWVKLLTENGEVITISLQRDTTIAKELSGDRDIEITVIDYIAIAGYNAARVTYTTWIESKDTYTGTQVEINGDLIYVPDINQFPELEKVIESFVISEK